MADYGWGVEVNAGGSWQFDKDGKTKIVNDRDNLGQQVSLRLRSIRGSHPFDPEFGLDIDGIIEYRKYYRNLKELVEVVILQCLIKHPHVRQIDYIIIEERDNRLWEIEIRVVTDDEREVYFKTLMQQNVDTRRVIYEY